MQLVFGNDWLSLHFSLALTHLPLVCAVLLSSLCVPSLGCTFRKPGTASPRPQHTAPCLPGGGASWLLSEGRVFPPKPLGTSAPCPRPHPPWVTAQSVAETVTSQMGLKQRWNRDHSSKRRGSAVLRAPEF